MKIKKNISAVLIAGLLFLCPIILSLVGYFGYKNYNQIFGYKTYMGVELGISLKYPSTWTVSELGGDTPTTPKIYFSPEKFDLSDTQKIHTAGYVQIGTRDIIDLFLTEKYSSKSYSNAQQLLDDLIQEQKEYVGPPRTGPDWKSLGTPKRPFLSGAISVLNMQTIDGGDSLYWIIKNGKLYEFLIKYPTVDKPVSDFDRKIEIMTSSFKFEE